MSQAYDKCDDARIRGLTRSELLAVALACLDQAGCKLHVLGSVMDLVEWGDLINGEDK